MTEVRPKQQRPQARARTRSIIVISGDYLGDFRKLSLYTNPSWIGRTKKTPKQNRLMLLRVVKRGTKTLSYPHGHFQGSQQLLRTETIAAESEAKQQQKTKAKGWKGKERCCNLKPRSLTPFPLYQDYLWRVWTWRERATEKGKRGGGAHFLQGPPPVKNVTLRKEVQLLHYYTFICFFVFKGVITKIKAP